MRYLLLILILVTPSTLSQTFDLQHQRFTEVLQQHVVVYNEGLKSAVDYATLASAPEPLNSYLRMLSAVTEKQYQQWSDSQQLAFLINAYNAFTLQLIIENFHTFKSGNAESIRDLGGFFTSPWEQEFFTLLGEKRTLDWLEHEKIRVDFDEPRIHAALVCAAVSCPKLRAEAFVGDKLEQQLDDQMVSFLRDRNKNGIDDRGLYLSKIFDWYAEDFKQVNEASVREYMRQYAQALADNEEQRQRLTETDIAIRYTDYNWNLNSRSRLQRD
ncbi:DUF547 domain-containing protein [Idiomarina sp. OT37-5b]|jgi:hypothetical protein|uniref:DUF547 domain-containing protein n=1 Tax=Idiomarina sp. OT37-5b TaxID=2100422 RepID=UPI000CFA5CA3|nr:DUF547 domain-containing protein [Idiomarina sp. OT37-5b]AVJ55324.1 DUF547 domain-containing protein [Idiomarina sp. OT37-5b]